MLDPVGSDANKHHLHCNIDSKLRGNVRGNEKSSSGSGNFSRGFYFNSNISMVIIFKKE